MTTFLDKFDQIQQHNNLNNDYYLNKVLGVMSYLKDSAKNTIDLQKLFFDAINKLPISERMEMLTDGRLAGALCFEYGLKKENIICLDRENQEIIFKVLRDKEYEPSQQLMQLLALSKIKDFDNITHDEYKDIVDMLDRDHLCWLEAILTPEQLGEVFRIFATENTTANTPTYSSSIKFETFKLFIKAMCEAKQFERIQLFNLPLVLFITLCETYPELLYLTYTFYEKNMNNISIPNIMKDKTIPDIVKILFGVSKICVDKSDAIPMYLHKALNELIPVIKMHGYNYKTISDIILQPYIKENKVYKPSKLKENETKLFAILMSDGTYKTYSSKQEWEFAYENFIHEGKQVYKISLKKE